jgi:hypothetical protein
VVEQGRTTNVRDGRSCEYMWVWTSGSVRNGDVPDARRKSSVKVVEDDNTDLHDREATGAE